jgi:hypothetical protein
MKLPHDLRERFRRYGRTGGLRRAARMGRSARTAVARRAATARWVRERFGSTSFEALGFPGGQMVDTGLADLAEGRVSAESLLVSLAASRLRREGVPLKRVHANPEKALFGLLARGSGDLAHARYGALLRQISSFADSCRRARLERRPGAS